MTHDPNLERLQKALKGAVPKSDPAKKAEILAKAQKNFDAHQENLAPARPIQTSAPFGAGIWTGAKTMFEKITLRRVALITTCVYAVGATSYFLTNNMSFLTKELANRNQNSQDTYSDAGAWGESSPAPKKSDRADPGAWGGPSTPSTSSGAGWGGDISEVAPQSLPKLHPHQNGVEKLGVDSDLIFSHSTQDRNKFANKDTNPLKVTSETPVSTFSIDVDTASYSLIRKYVNSGRLPPKDAVRIEEMINYFPYDYPAPDNDIAPFKNTVSTFQTPWNPHTKLVHIGIKGETLQKNEKTPIDLVFLIDVSGSMNSPDKLPLLISSLTLLLDSLQPDDKIAIVTYAGRSAVELEPTEVKNRGKIMQSLSMLRVGGGTHGAAGLRTAYDLAETMKRPDAVSRIILATDGDFNLGLADENSLEQFISRKRKSGTYLSVLGFGMGNLQDGIMQRLAQFGNGIAAYIDSLPEAQKVLVDQAAGSLYPIADDVKIQVEFNPAKVAEYRLIGYETRALRREDFNNDAIDAGEIGAGHTVTALYEVTPVGSPAIKNTPLRYKTNIDKDMPVKDAPNELGFLKLRYKAPGEKVSKLIQTPIFAETISPSIDAQFATAIAGFGEVLRGSPYINDWSLKDSIDLAISARGADIYGYRNEAAQLMRLTESLSR